MSENVEVKKDSREQYSPYTHWLKENVEAIVVAFIAAMVIRCFAVEVFQIPTKSMEPTLMGHVITDDSGRVVESLMDRIMVTKFFYQLAPVERFDVAVFKFPLNQSKNFIKRVVGMPDEKFFVEGGNIYYRKNDSTDERYLLAKKPLRVQESIWITPAGVPQDFLSDRDTFLRYWLAEGTANYSVVGDKLTTNPAGGKNMEFRLRHPIRQYYRDNESSDIVGDVKFSCYWRTDEPGGSFYIRIENEFGRFYVNLEAAGESKFTYVNNTGESKSQPIINRSIRPMHTYEVQLEVFDGAAVVHLDGDPIVRYDFLTYYSPSSVNLQSNYTIAFGSQSSAFAVENIKVWRDIFYRARTNISEGVPINIPKGCHIMMGDNVADSHDSRGWQVYRFILKDGREAICESQELDRGDRYEGRSYDYVVKNDIHGNGWQFNRTDIQEEFPPEQRPFVEEKYIIGKAFLIWWPPSRALRLIR